MKKTFKILILMIVLTCLSCIVSFNNLYAASNDMVAESNVSIEFLPEGDKAVYEGQMLEFIIEAESKNNQSLTYTAGNLPEGAFFDSESRKFIWIPDYNQAGEYNDVYFGVTDSNYIKSIDVNITVFNRNRAPEIEEIVNKKVVEGEELKFNVNAQDPDNDQLKYSAGNLPEGAVFDVQTQTFKWTPETGQADLYKNVSFFVIDNSSSLERLMDVEKIDVKVKKADNIPPVTTVSLKGNKWSDGWFKTKVEVALNAKDNPGGTGVKAIYYKFGKNGTSKR